MTESTTDRSPRASAALVRPRASIESMVAGLALAAVVATWRGLLLLVDGGVVPLPLLAVVVAALVLGVLTVTAHVGVGTTYRLLPEASSQDCRVVAREDSFLMGGGGSLYTLRGESGLARRVQSFSTDDGERPFTNGSAELRWRGETATVTGPLWDASEYGPLMFSC